MNSNQYIKYIESGLGIRPERNQFRKIALGPFLLVLLMGVIPCVVLGGNWMILLIIMLVTSITITIVVFIISLKQLTIRNRLIMQAFIYSNWVLQTLMLQIMFYLITWGADFVLVILCMPPLITPLVLGLLNGKRLRSNSIILQKRSASVIFPFAWGGIIGVLLAKSFFHSSTNKMVMLFVIVSLTVLSCIFSIGLLSYQRLFYLKKYAN